MLHPTNLASVQGARCGSTKKRKAAPASSQPASHGWAPPRPRHGQSGPTTHDHATGRVGPPHHTTTYLRHDTDMSPTGGPHPPTGPTHPTHHGTGPAPDRTPPDPPRDGTGPTTGTHTRTCNRTGVQARRTRVRPAAARPWRKTVGKKSYIPVRFVLCRKSKRTDVYLFSKKGISLFVLVDFCQKKSILVDLCQKKSIVGH